MKSKRILARLLHGFNFFNADYALCRGWSLPPRSVCLVLSHACNLRCTMCDIGRANARDTRAGISPLVQAVRSGPDPLSREEWLSLVDQLASFVPRPLVLLTGAEPFMAPHWSAIAERILQRGLRLHITTNATLLERSAGQLTALCPHPDALDITVSLDGLESVHDRVRGVEGTFALALGGMRAFEAAWRRRGWGRAPLHITCTLSNHNLDHVPAFVAALTEYGLPVASLTINHLWFRDSTIAACHNKTFAATMPAAEENIQGVDIAAMHADRLLATVAAVKNTAARSRFPVFFEPELSEPELGLYYSRPERFVCYNKCTAAWRNVTVTPSGSIILSPLCFLPALGSVKNSSFRSVWNARPARQLRRTIRRTGAWPACARCCMLFGSRPKYHKLASLLRY